MSRFINTELKSDSDSNSDSELDPKSRATFDAELMAKLISSTKYNFTTIFFLSQIKYFN